jgi:DNA modification methylase
MSSGADGSSRWRSAAIFSVGIVDQIRQIAKSMVAYGFVDPLLVDGSGVIIAGCGRVAAALLLGYTELPVIILDHLTEPQRRALALALNKIPEIAGWDQEALAIEFGFLIENGLDFSVNETGFSLPEIDFTIHNANEPDEPGIDDAVPEPEPQVVSKLGDLWRLSGHLILCGDARDATSYERLLGSTKAVMGFIDAPYNVPVHGHIGGSGKVQHGEFIMASGEMTDGEFKYCLRAYMTNMERFSVKGAMNYHCIDWRSVADLICIGKEVYSDFVNLCAWNKNNGGMGSLYRSKHELIAVFKVGDGKAINNVELGRWGRNRSNVWDYPGVNTFRSGRDDELAMHPTVKNCAMVADAIMDAPHRGDIVLDVFAGSGTTIISAAKTDRVARVMELDPKYVDVAIRRWEQWSGIMRRPA